jgi:predicted nucleotidyltransferase
VVDRVHATLLAALADLVKWLDDAKMPSMIIGGVAASVLGRPRLTQDVDALAILPEADWADAVSTAAHHGIHPRIENPLDFARRSRVLLMRHVESGIDIDLTFGRLSFELTAIDHSEIHDVGGVRVRLPRVEDLLIMKAIARRPKDLQDIEGLLAANPDADVVAVRQWVREFATAMSMSDMLDDFDKVVARSRSTR